MRHIRNTINILPMSKIPRFRSIVFSAIMIIIILVNVGSVAARKADALPNQPPTFDKTYRGWDLPRKIAIFYDSNHSILTATAFNVLASASMVYHNTYIFTIKDWDDLRSLILDADYWIKLYFINGKIDGVYLGDQIIEWGEIARILSSNPSSYHVFGSGSTNQLRTYVPVNQTNIRIEGSPVLGAEQSYFYNLWEIGDILAGDPGLGYQKVGEDFRMLGVKYFAENCNRLLNGIIEPSRAINPLGEEDVQARIQAWEEKQENWSDAYQVMPDKSIRRFDTESIPAPNTRLRIINASTVEEEEAEFKISDIPLFSGMDGAAAGVIDAILSVLIKFGGSALGLDPETAIGICNTIKDIATMFANRDEGEGDVKGTIKSLIKLITDNAPISEKIKPFLPLIVDALYLIRGEPNDITDFAGSVIETVFTVIGEFTKNTTVGNSSIMTTMMKVLKDTLLNGVDLAEDMIDAKKEAEEEGKKFNALNVVVTFAIDKVLNATTYSWWSEVLGGTNSTILKEVGKLMGFLGPLVKAFATGDFDDLMDTIPEVVEYLFSKMSNQTLTEKEESACATIGQFYRAAMTFYDSFSLGGNALEYWTTAIDLDANLANQKVFSKLINAALPMLDVTVTAGDTRASSFATSLVSILADASIAQMSDRNLLKQLISSSMSANNLPTTSPEAETLIDALAWLGAIWIPTMVEPFASDIKGVSKQFLNFTTTNTTVSAWKEKALFVVIETIFGIIALGKSNTAAQLLLIDDASKLRNAESLAESDPQELKDIQLKMVLIAKNAVVGLFNIWVLEKTNSTKVVKAVEVLTDLVLAVAGILISGQGNSITAFLRTVAMQAGTLFFDKVLGVNGTATMRVIQSLFTGIIGKNLLGGEAVFNATQTSQDLQDLIGSELEKRGVSASVVTLAKKGIHYLFMIKDLISGGIDFIMKEFKTLLASFLADLISEFTGKIAAKISGKPLLAIAGTIGLPGGDVIGIKLTYNLSIGLGFEWDNEAFRTWIEDIIFTGIDDFKLDIPEFFKKILTFITFAPIFSAELGCEAVDSGKGGILSAVLAPLGVDLEVWGSIGFSIQLFAFSAGGFDSEGFMKLLGWHFSIGFKVSKTITLIELILYATGGGAAVAGTATKAMQYIGLELLDLTLWLSASFEIYQKAAHNGEPAQGSLTLTLGIGAFISIGLDLGFVGVSFKIGLDIYLIFFQNLAPGNNDPFMITLDIVFWAKLVLTFLFWDFEIGFEFRPPGFPLDLSPGRDDPDLEENALGFDFDFDGLSDDIEFGSPSLNPRKDDTDSDWLSDKFELKVSKTDPDKYDTDGDGLSDFFEWYGGSPRADPNVVDTDMDGISDGEEVLLYRTDPNSRDTDNDGLTDYYEITTDWNITSVTPSVTAVQIGDTIYDNHTDPLNPDTDDDGLLDGQEGAFGPWWGNPNNYPKGSDEPMLLFNEGYTHPLDNDTDDDSYYQYYDGSIAGTSESRVFLRDMRDGVEVKGIAATVVEVDPDGFIELVSSLFQTNPCNPDSDGDTGAKSRVATAGFFLNSDGYELSQDPASDPLDADTDNDGLIDGLEGTLLPERNTTTSFSNPDTDGDSLPDGIELALGTNPGDPDTDHDLVLDGDEFFVFFTNPRMPDTDYDGVEDYWELFFSHSNPHSADSDGDGIRDYEEIYIYGSDPVDEDSDNDNLRDRDEIFEYNTDPMNPDSDGDGIRDGPEILIYETDPNNIDSDFDSILSPDENGDPTFLWTDYDEIMYGTNPRSIDTDNDSIMDTWELYLAQGDIPNFANIPLDPLDNDTDDDGLRDGQELVISEVEILVFPFIGYQSIHPLLTSPIDADSDDDELGDKFEVDNNLRPDLNDTDNDTLSDWDEIYTHKTDPRKNDTDGDGLLDKDEVTAVNVTGGGAGISEYNPRYMTNALDPDSDSDGWPDGLEINATDGDPRYNPYDPDTNNNGILDGYERDYDHDLISDGDEYYTYNSYGTQHGGFLDYRNPDSDFDGLMDGDEILVYGTLPYSADSDRNGTHGTPDGYSDPLELWIGTDPNVYTPEEEFLAAVLRLTSPLQMKSPQHNGNYSVGPISFEMLNLTTLSTVSGEVYFRYREKSQANNQTQNQTATWSKNYTLKYQGFSRWTHGEISFKKGEYEFQIFGLATNYSYPTSPDRIIGSVLLDNMILFRVVEVEIDWGTIILIGFAGAVVLASAAFVAAILIRRRRALV